jgi:hypothetical protein
VQDDGAAETVIAAPGTQDTVNMEVFTMPVANLTREMPLLAHAAQLLQP